MAKTVRRRVQMKLTAEEVSKKARQLTEVLDKSDQVLEAKKAKATEYKGVLESLDAGARLLREHIVRGREEREVECCFEKDYKKGTVKFFSLGTGDLVDERGMTEDERQAALTDDLDEIETEEASKVIELITGAIPSDGEEHADPAIAGAQQLIRGIWGEPPSDEDTGPDKEPS